MQRLILPSVFAAGLAACFPASAETVNRTLDGSRLEIRMNCAKLVTIDPEPGLQGKIEIEATAAAQAELDPLVFTEGAAARVERKGECQFHDRQPSLTIAIKVPAATPIDLRDEGSGDFRIGAVGAALKIVVEGSGNVEAASGTDLELHVAGSGDVDLDRLDGPGKIEIHGSGNVRIGNGTIPSLAIAVHGSGDVKLDGGEVGTLAASASGSGDIQIDGTVKDATLAVAGSGDIDVAKATGAVQSQKSGSGSNHIGS
jgi:hypothetical protein